MQALRKHALNYLDQLCMLTTDRRHAKDATVLMAELKTGWCRVQKLLGRSRDKAGGSLVPGWTIVQRRPTYVITRQPPAGQVDPALSPGRVSDGSQHSIEGYFSRVPPPPNPARPASATPTLRTAPSTQTRLRSPPAPALPARTTTPAPLSHGD